MEPGTPRLIAVLIFASLLAGPGVATHAEERRHFRYDYPYPSLFPEDRQELRNDMGRLRRQLQRQERQLEQQYQLQQEQYRLMRREASADRRVSAIQACYYRLQAGLELCDDLFDTVSAEIAACRKLVVEKNPACARDVDISEVRSGD